MKQSLWRRAVLTLLPALVIGATTATVIGPGIASAALSDFTVPAQTPSPVTAGGTATFSPITVQDSSSGHWVSLTATGLGTGETFSDSADGCVAENSGTTTTFTHAQVATTASAAVGTDGFTNTAPRWIFSGCTVGSNGSSTGNGSVLIAKAPVATASAATGTTSTASTLNGSVNAENASTAVTFCYSTSSSIGNCTGTVTTVNGSTPTVTGNTNTAETAALSGLAPGTQYFFNIEAVNSAGTTFGTATSFTTLAAAPTATTNAATSVTGSGGTLNGSVNAGGASRRSATATAPRARWRAAWTGPSPR